MTSFLGKHGQIWSIMVKDGRQKMVKEYGQKTWSVHSQKKSTCTKVRMTNDFLQQDNSVLELQQPSAFVMRCEMSVTHRQTPIEAAMCRHC
jgi:hypothetical protein